MLDAVVDGMALVVGGDRGGTLAAALESRGVQSVLVDDAVAAMSALGRADFRALVFATPQRSNALPLRALWRVAQMRHPGIALVHVTRGYDEGVVGDAVYALPLDASDQEIATHVVGSLAAFDPVDAFLLPPDTVTDDAIRLGVPPLLEGTLAPGGAAPILASIFAQELTGKLAIDGNPGVYFAQGEPVAVDLIVEQVAPGGITAPRGVDGKSATQLLRVHRERVRDRVLALLENATGAYVFTEEREFLDTRLLSRVSTFGMILEARRRHMDPASLASTFAQISSQYLCPGVGIERATQRLLPFTRGVDAAPLITGKGTVSEFLGRIGLDHLMGTLVVLTLVDAGLASLSATPGDDRRHGEAPSPVQLGEIANEPNPFELGEGNSAVAEQGELAERVSKLYLEMKPTTDPYVVLGLQKGSQAPSEEEVEAAYQRRLASLNVDDPSTTQGVHSRLDELRRKADIARDALLGDQTEPLPRAPAADRVGRYELLRSLGQGGMAEVFLGRQVGAAGFAKQVVVKRILERYANDPDIVRMFLEEARIAARVSHPNVVQIYDLGEAEGEYYIVMEYVEGLDFAALLNLARQAHQPVPFEVAAFVVAEMCAGLHAAHCHLDDAGRPAPIIHRDVSTQNVLVSLNGHVKIADFGVAKRADAVSQTMPGLLKGKPAYLAPEYIRGSPADARSDVFAAGLVLYTALTGTHPFDRMTPMQSMKAILGADLPPIEELRSDIPSDMRTIVGRALAHEVANRFQSAQALRLALFSFIAAHGRAMSQEQLAEWVMSFSDSRPVAAPVPEADAFEHAENTVELQPYKPKR